MLLIQYCSERILQLHTQNLVSSCFLRSTPPNRANKASLFVQCPSIHTYISPCICPSQKVFLIWTKFGMYVGQWVIHDGMPYDPIKSQGQGQGHRSPIVAKMTNFKVYLLCQYACNQWTNDELNYDIPRQYLHFNLTDFWYSSSFAVVWPSNWCSTFGNFASYEELTSSPVQGLFYLRVCFVFTTPCLRKK